MRHACNPLDVYKRQALAWRITEEEFMKDIDWLNNLKLRVRFGQSGNDNVGAYQTQGSIRDVYKRQTVGGRIVRKAEKQDGCLCPVDRSTAGDVCRVQRRRAIPHVAQTVEVADGDGGFD